MYVNDGVIFFGCSFYIGPLFTRDNSGFPRNVNICHKLLFNQWWWAIVSTVHAHLKSLIKFALTAPQIANWCDEKIFYGFFTIFLCLMLFLCENTVEPPYVDHFGREYFGFSNERWPANRVVC